MQKYLIRWKINEHCSFGRVFEGLTKTDATEEAKRYFTKQMPHRKGLWKKENLTVTELIEERKDNGDDNGFKDEED